MNIQENRLGVEKIRSLTLSASQTLTEILADVELTGIISDTVEKKATIWSRRGFEYAFNGADVSGSKRPMAYAGSSLPDATNQASQLDSYMAANP